MYEETCIFDYLPANNAHKLIYVGPLLVSVEKFGRVCMDTRCAFIEMNQFASTCIYSLADGRNLVFLLLALS